MYGASLEEGQEDICKVDPKFSIDFKYEDNKNTIDEIIKTIDV